MDIVVMRALLEGDDSNFQGVLAKSDKDLVAWANKKRPAARIPVVVESASARREVGQLERDIDRLRKKGANLSLGINLPKNAAKELEAVANILPRLKDTKATITINRAGNADLKELQQIGRLAANLKDKTVDYRVNYTTSGTPPTPPPPGNNNSRVGGTGGAPEPRNSPWDDRMNTLQAKGYYSMAAGSALSAAFTAPLVAGGAAVVKFAGDYEEAMQHVVTLTDVSKDELKSLYTQVLQLSDDKRIRQGPVELADALYYVTSTGLKGADGMKVLKAAAIGASAGLGETQVVANTVTTILDSYGLSADKAAKVTDVLTEAVRFGKGEADQYAAAFPKLIAIASQAGISFEEVAAQMASATRLGLTPSETATALRQIFQNLIAPSEKASKAFQEIGTSAGELRVMLQQKGLFNTLKDLMERTGGRIGPITELFGSIRALTSFLATTGDATLGEYRKTLEATMNASGSSMKAAATASETYQFQLDRLGATIQRVLIENGKDGLAELNNLAETTGEKLPASIKTLVTAWNELDPATQSAFKGLALLLAAAGPLKIMSGTATILASSIGTLATGVGSAGGILKFLDALKTAGPALTAIRAGGVASMGASVGIGAGGALTGAAAAAGGTAIALAALVPIYELLAIKAYNFQAKVEDSINAQHNAEVASKNLAKGLDRALDFSKGSAEIRTAFEAIKKGAEGAGGDAKKLQDTLTQLEKQRVNVGANLNIDPTGKMLLLREIERLRGTIESRLRDIVVDFDASEAFRKLRDLEGRDDNSAKLKELREQLKEALRDGNLSRVAQIRQQIGDISTPQGTAPERKNVKEMTDSEIAKEKEKWDQLSKDKVRLDSEQTSRSEAIFREHYLRRDKIQQSWAADKAAADERARIAAEELAKAQEETAERLRRIEVMELQKRLQNWQTFGSAIEAYASNLSKIGSEKGESSKLAAEAQMARKEFAAIPPELRAMVIGLAAVNDEMKRLTGTRDQMRGLFSDMYKEAVRSGSPTAGIVAQAKEFEKSLNYSARMKAQFERGQGMAGKLSNEAEYNRRRYSDHIETLQGAGTMAGAKFRADAYVNANTAAANAGILETARGFLGQGQSNPAIWSAMGSAAGNEWCVGFIQAVRKRQGEAVLPGGLSVSGIRAAAQKTGNAYTGAPNVGDVATIKGYGKGRGYVKSHAAIVASVNRQKGTFTTIGGNEGNENNSLSRVKEGREYSYGSSAIVFVRSGNGALSPVPVVEAPKGTPKGNPIFPSQTRVTAPKMWDGKSPIPAPPVEQAAPLPIPASSKVGKRISATPQLPTTKPVSRGNVRSPEFDGSILDMGLPKGWGKAISEFGISDGETRTWQLRIQEMLLDTKAATKAAKDMGMTLDQFAATWKVIAKNRDTANDIARATDEGRKQVRQLERNAFFAKRGGSTPLSEFHYDASQGKYNRTSSELRSSIIEGILASTTANMQGEGTQFRKNLADQQKVRGFGQQFVNQGDNDRADYEIEKGQRRLDIWNSAGLEQQRKDINDLKAKQKQQMDGGTYEGFYASIGTRMKVRELQDAHDAEFKGRVDASEKEFDAENLDKAKRAFNERNKELTRSIGLLEYEKTLIGMNASDRERMVAIEEKKRQVLEDSLKFEQNATPERRKELEAAATAEAKRLADLQSGKTGLGFGDENKSFDDNAKIIDRMNAQKLAQIGRLPSDSPELAVQLRLIEERGRLEAENLDRATDMQIDVDKRLQTIEKQVRAEDLLARVTTMRQNALAAQNDILEAQKQNELTLAKTAREKLAIEWRYLDAKRQREGTPTSAEERASRARMAEVAADAERIERMKEGATETRDAFSSAMQEGFLNPLKGAESLIHDLASAARKYFADDLAKRFIPDGSGGLLDMIGLGKPMDKEGGGLPVGFNGAAEFNERLVAVDPNDKTDFGPIGPRPTTAYFEEIKNAIISSTGFTPDSRKGPSGNGDILDMIQSALRTGINAATVQVNTPVTNVSGANVNVAGGGSGFSLFGGNGGRGGGGAGTTPTFKQQMETTEI